MNEAETRAEYIDPKLKASGWGITEGTKVSREYKITAGKIQTGGGRAKPLIADYVLVYQGRKLAIIEAKSDELDVGEGVAQAKNYAGMLRLDMAYASNGKEIYHICMKTGKEGLVAAFPSPDELWNKTFDTQNQWRDKFNQVPFEDVGGTKDVRYYQEIAVNNAMSAIAEDKPRVLLTLATVTGKTFIAFQIEPVEPESKMPREPKESKESEDISREPAFPYELKKKIKVKLRDGKEREIQHIIATSFWSADGKPISAEEFLKGIFGRFPDFFKSENELRKIWSNPITRKALLEKLFDAGYGADVLVSLQKLINAEKSDLFDVLEYISFAIKPITRETRVARAQTKIFKGLDNKHKEFLEFVLSKYIETGVEELDQEKLPDLLTLKYQAIRDAEEILGGVDNIRTTFIDFQKYLYEEVAA